MITAPADFKSAIESGNRDYQILASITLESGTVLSLTNEHIWSSGFSHEDFLCSSADILEIGTAIVNKITLIINNMDESYSLYDFTDAVVTVQLGLKPDEESAVSYITKATGFIVDTADYNGTLITLTCLDKMALFDQQAVSALTYPATAYDVVDEACTACGVTLGVQSFSGDTTQIPLAPTEGVTYRQMLSWIGQMVGCCWRINTAGELMPLWYDLTTLGQFWDGGTFAYTASDALDGGTFLYTDGDSADGGTFTEQAGIFQISYTASNNVAVDDTLITGVTIFVQNDTQDDDAQAAYTEHSTGTDGFRIQIVNNPEITEDNVSAILSTLASRLIGMRYRKGQMLHLSDPRLEAGDVFVFTDAKGYSYPMICSQTIFTVGAYQTTVSSSETPARNSSQRFSSAMNNTVEIYNTVRREKTSRETAETLLQQAIDGKPGLYMSTESDGLGGTIYILHDKPVKTDSTILWKMSSEAFGVSTNGGTSYNAGLTADGTVIAQRLYAETITAGILQSADYAYTSGYYSDAGMIVDLNSKIIRSPKFAITSNGELYAKDATLSGLIKLGQLTEDMQAYTQIDYHSMQMIDKDSNTFFYVSDLRDSTGYASLTETFTGDGSTTTFYVSLTPSSVTSVTVNGSAAVYIQNNDAFIFSPTPANGDSIVISYKTTSAWAKAYTLGLRGVGTVGGMSVVEGASGVASAFASHAEGYATSASGVYSHAEGYLSIASGTYSHAEGDHCEASKKGTHAEGVYTQAIGIYAHAQNMQTIASGSASHAEGAYTTASGDASHAQNYETIAASDYQTVIGKYNISDSSDVYAFIIGNGTASNARSNALTVDWNGNIRASGSVYGANLQAGSSTDTTNSSVIAANTSRIISLAVNTNGWSGIYNSTGSKWMVGYNGTSVYLDGGVALYDRGAFTGDLNSSDIPVGIYQLSTQGSASNMPTDTSYSDFMQLPHYGAQIIVRSNKFMWRNRTGSPAAWNPWRTVTYT